jgi:quinol monooxygenase YgiN
VLGSILLAAATVAARPQTPAPSSAADQTFHAVSYVETAAASATEALKVVRTYREAVARQDGCVQADAFEQIGRPGHWVVIETWRDAKAFDARDA